MYLQGAAELEAEADRAGARGDVAAARALLERATAAARSASASRPAAWLAISCSTPLL